MGLESNAVNRRAITSESGYSRKDSLGGSSVSGKNGLVRLAKAPYKIARAVTGTLRLRRSSPDRRNRQCLSGLSIYRTASVFSLAHLRHTFGVGDPTGQGPQRENLGLPTGGPSRRSILVVA